MENNMNDIFESLNDLLKDVDLSDITADSNVFSELPDGYYLCEVETAQLKETKTGNPMVSFQLKVIEDGVNLDETTSNFITLSKTKNRKIFLNYVLKNDASIRRFVTDMLKFEGDTEDEPILGKEYFTTSQLLVDALDVLVGLRIYVVSSTTVNSDETTSNWKNLISWKRAKALDLPM